MTKREISDENIIVTITTIRARYDACTMHAVAEVLSMPITTLHQRLVKLRAAGRVKWSTMQGSLNVTEESLDAPKTIVRRAQPKRNPSDVVE